jgi:hypothetical protein|tara:strand:+ start:111 stop:542 length:432 start_codon:yes stop_codon:yes gene_type:complete
MPLGYDPNMIESGGGGRVNPGTYAYRVVEAVEKTFRSGNLGLELKLDVLVGDRAIPVYERIAYKQNVMWKMRKFAESAGFDPMRSPEVHQLVGMQGRAEFAKDSKGYLEVDEFLPKKDNASAPAPAPAPAPVTAAPVGDDVPF